MVGRFGLDVQKIDHLLHQRRFLAAVEKASIGEALDHSKRQVLAYAFCEQQPLPAPVLRNKRNTVTADQGCARIANRGGLAPKLDASVCLGRAEQRLEKFALAVTLKAANAEHLAFAQREGHTL